MLARRFVSPLRLWPAPAAIWASASPVQAQIVSDPRLSPTAALARDANTALALVQQQMAMPFTDPFGLPVLLALCGLALLLAWPARLWLLRRMAVLLAASPLDRGLAVAAKAVGALVGTTLLVSLAGQIALAGMEWSVTLLPVSRSLAQTLAMAVGIAGFGLGIGRALRSPDDKGWRPAQLPPGLGAAVGFYPFAAGAMLGLTNFFDQMARLLHASQTGWTVVQGVIALAETLLIARFLVVAGQARQRQVETVEDAGKPPAIPAIFGMTALVWGLLALALGAFVLGHVRFAVLILQELLWAGLVLAAAWLLSRFIDALLTQVLNTNSTVGRFATAVVGVQRARVKQLALLGSALLTVIVWVFALGLVAAPLRGDHAVVIEQVKPVPLLQSVQSLKLSPGTVGMALFVLFVGVALTRMVRGWMEKRFLPSTSLDVGVRTSLVTGISYVGIIIALLCASSAMGLQLEKITLIASALSVGIGFGLQSIIQNFVSGVILLIERPVKQGDWVAVSGAEGTIRRIRVRATELATADGGTAIVPNSSFISSNVSNRADTLAPHRLDLGLTVTGCPNAGAARDVILGLLESCAAVREDPAPRLFLTTLGEGEWVFTLKVYARPGNSVTQAKSDLLFWLSGQTEGQEIKIKAS
jgi:small-conductance mechanosensitive channel